MKIPPVRIKENLDKEIQQFWGGLHREKNLWLKGLIFYHFPEIKKLEESKPKKSKEAEFIRNVIIDFREKHDKEIKRIIKHSKAILKKKSKKTLKVLAILMDYKWLESHPGYTAAPVVLPYSPYGENIFYFSILGQIKEDKKSNDVLFLAVHEISHMILYEILKEHKKEKYIKSLNWLPFNYLKEILASVLINQKPLAKLLAAKNYLGNINLHHIYILKDGKKTQICNFFQEIYEKLRYKEKRNFIYILKVITRLILLIKDKLKEKDKLWNKYGYRTIIEKKLLEEYSKPIKVKSL